MPTKTSSAAMDEGVQDAVALLIADHRKVARLFAAFQSVKDGGSDQQKMTLVRQVCLELKVHTAIEEEIFYPAVREAIDDDDLMDEALVEHAGAKELMAQLQAATPADELYDAKVTVLGEQIDHHVTEEEGSLFPLARGAGLDTLSLGASMLTRRRELLGGAQPESPATVASRPRKAAEKKVTAKKRAARTKR